MTAPNEYLATLNYESLVIKLECWKDGSAVIMERCNKIVDIDGKEIR